jgi:excisionase family DNA binding protein
VINRRPTSANDARGNAVGKDDLTRLVRLIAQQAAQEAIRAFVEALERPLGPDGPLSGAAILHRACAEGMTSGAGPTNPSNERFFSVDEVADRLGVSPKSVRRKIDKGELTAHRMGRLLRIGERSLAVYIAGARRQNRR